MKVKAILRKFQCSPKKVRLVADQVRGLKVDKASTILLFINKKSSQPILKLLQSAIANAENNYKLNKENLVLEKITIDSDGMYKRITPRARGTSSPILKRLSRIEIILGDDDKNLVKVEKIKKTTSKKETNKVIDNK